MWSSLSICITCGFSFLDVFKAHYPFVERGKKILVAFKQTP